MHILKSLAGLSAASLLTAGPALACTTCLVDPDAIKPVDPPILTPEVVTPPVYYPPTPVVPVYPPTPSPKTGWYSRSVYVVGYGTRYVEYRTLSSGLRTIKVWGPKGKEKLKDVNCWNNTFRAPKNKNPFRFQYETVKAVCRY